MADAPVRRYHRSVVFLMVLVNILAITYGLCAGLPGQRDYYFREGALVPWLFAAQLYTAAVLFVACYFAGRIMPLEDMRRRDMYGWLVFASGFFLLAIDQQFLLREQLTAIIEGGPVRAQMPLYGVLKLVIAGAAVLLVYHFRALVLRNLFMVLCFAAGFWFLLLMLIFDVFLKSLGVPDHVVPIVEGSAKLLAMAMFVSAPFLALLDGIHEVRLAVMHGNSMRRPVVERRVRASAAAAESSAAPSTVDEFAEVAGAEQAEPAEVAGAEQAEPEEPALRSESATPEQHEESGE